MSDPSQNDSRWLSGPFTDVMIGAGGVYLLSFPVIVLGARQLGVSEWPALWVAGISLFISAPHYGATLLRVYGQPEERRRYRLFAIHLSGVLALAFVGGAYSAWLGSLLLTAYVTLGPWHTSGQNYGVALMFLRRAGVEVEPGAKRCLYASFLLSYALTLLATHVADSSVHYAAGVSELDRYAVMRLGLPVEPTTWLGAGLLAGYGVCLVYALGRFARAGGLRVVTPVLLLAASQALWFVVPTVLHAQGQDASRALPFAAIWISAAHSAQYLWVTLHYARREDASLGRQGYLLRTLLVGSFIVAVPAMALELLPLGGATWHAGLAPLLFAVVNLHHYALDGAVWKLRDGHVARALLDTGAPPPIEARGVSAGWGSRVVLALGAVALLVAVYEVFERSFTLRDVSNRDLTRAERALDRLGWVGRESARDRLVIGRALARQGERERAERSFRRSLALAPTPTAWRGLAEVQATEGRWEDARGSLEAALDLEPGSAPTQLQLAQVFVSLERDAATPEQGASHRRENIAMLESFVEAAPRNVAAHLFLARAYERDGRVERAVALIEDLVPRIIPRNRPVLRDELERLASGGAPPAP